MTLDAPDIRSDELNRLIIEDITAESLQSNEEDEQIGPADADERRLSLHKSIVESIGSIIGSDQNGNTIVQEDECVAANRSGAAINGGINGEKSDQTGKYASSNMGCNQIEENGEDSGTAEQNDEAAGDMDNDADYLDIFDEDGFMSDLLDKVTEDVQMPDKSAALRTKMHTNRTTMPVAPASAVKSSKVTNGFQAAQSTQATTLRRPPTGNRVPVKQRLGMREPIVESQQALPQTTVLGGRLPSPLPLTPPSQKATDRVVMSEKHKMVIQITNIAASNRAQSHQPLQASRPAQLQQPLNLSAVRSPVEPVSKAATQITRLPSAETAHSLDLVQFSFNDPILSMPHSAPIYPVPVEFPLPSFARTFKTENVFDFVFSKVCRRFMYRKCPNNPNACAFEHRLPDTEAFRAKLSGLEPAQVSELYDVFILRNVELFKEFFAEFAEYFGKLRMDDKLTQMVTDCVQRRMQVFFRRILDGFTRMGVTFTAALKRLMQATKSHSTLTLNALVQAIFDTRNLEIQPFLDMLEKLSTKRDYQFAIEILNRMLRIQAASSNEQMGRILENVLVVRKFGDRVDKELFAVFLSARGEQGTGQKRAN